MDAEYIREKLTEERERLMEYIKNCFNDKRGREQAIKYICGLLCPIERKNGWQMAEALGDSTPYAIQQFLYRGRWEANDLRDSTRDYIKANMNSEDGVLVVDETGFLKKGNKSVGVKRQYSGTAGRIENSQVGVFLTYAAPQGFTIIDRELYIPEEWIDDKNRCEEAGIPETVEFKTKPQMALDMMKSAYQADVAFSWVTADSVYGDSGYISRWLESIEKSYVLAVSGKAYVWQGSQQHRVSTILEKLPEEGWFRLSCGSGSKGERYYDWLAIEIDSPSSGYWKRRLLVRKSISAPSDLQAYICFCSEDTTLQKLAEIAGSRWTVEQSFEEAKGEVGLDHYEVRSYQGWYKHISLACCALALLTVIKSLQQFNDIFQLSEEQDLNAYSEIPLEDGDVLFIPPPEKSNSLASFKKKRNL
jgi:SRSO17 transposase